MFVIVKFGKLAQLAGITNWIGGRHCDCPGGESSKILMMCRLQSMVKFGHLWLNFVQ